jgi:hypothetical protein
MPCPGHPRETRPRSIEPGEPGSFNDTLRGEPPLSQRVVMLSASVFQRGLEGHLVGSVFSSESRRAVLTGRVYRL